MKKSKGKLKDFLFFFDFEIVDQILIMKYSPMTKGTGKLKDSNLV